jgi:hypothetical protein
MLMNNRTFRSYPCTQLFSLHITSGPIHVSLERRAELIRSLDKWNFEPHKLPEHEVLYCSLVIFEALFRLEGLFDMVPVSIGACACLLPYVFPIDPSLIRRSSEGSALQHAKCLSSPEFVSQL